MELAEKLAFICEIIAAKCLISEIENTYQSSFKFEEI